MPNISTFLIWKSETTGIPDQDNNRTKYTKLSLLAVSKKGLLKGGSPKVRPLNFCLNPEFDQIIEEWGTYEEDYDGNGFLDRQWEEQYEDDPENHQTFSEVFDELLSFINSLPKPVCLVAHYGDGFDFPILRAQCKEAKRVLPKDLLCVDSLTACRKIVKSERRHNLFNMFSTLCTKSIDVADEQIRSQMLLEVLIAIKDQFVPWAIKNCKLLKSIKPLERPTKWS